MANALQDTSRAARARAKMYRELVLESAERVFARFGYHAAKMRDIAADAGISLNTLYAAFASKDEVFRVLHEWRGAEFLACIEPALCEPIGVLEALSRAVRGYTEFLVTHPDYLWVDLREGRSWAIGSVEGSPTWQRGIKLWTDLMRRGIAERIFYTDDPELMAIMALGLMQVQLAGLLDRLDQPDAYEIAKRIETQLRRTFCRPDAR